MKHKNDFPNEESSPFELSEDTCRAVVGFVSTVEPSFGQNWHYQTDDKLWQDMSEGINPVGI